MKSASGQSRLFLESSSTVRRISIPPVWIMSGRIQYCLDGFNNVWTVSILSGLMSKKVPFGPIFPPTHLWLPDNSRRQFASTPSKMLNSSSGGFYFIKYALRLDPDKVDVEVFHVHLSPNMLLNHQNSTPVEKCPFPVHITIVTATGVERSQTASSFSVRLPCILLPAWLVPAPMLLSFLAPQGAL